MATTVRVLVIGHPHHCISASLLDSLGLEFRWQWVASSLQFDRVVAQFGPALVLRAEELSVTAGRLSPALRRLLGLGSARVLVLSVSSPEATAPQRPLGMVGRYRLENALRAALGGEGLDIEFQPQFLMTTGRGTGVEALARWELPTGEPVPPAVFIPLAERAGLIRELGAWALDTACRHAITLCPDTGPWDLAVNVSALQIDEEFSTTLARVLTTTGFPADRLELEITESALIASPELTIEHRQDWKRLGVQIAIDDFGTGYSSLSYLARLPVDRLKLDQSLVHRTGDSRTAAVVSSIIALARNLGLDVVAEGIESEAHFMALRDMGCPQAQGYLLGRPMSREAVDGVLNRTFGNRPMPAAPQFQIEACPVH